MVQCRDTGQDWVYGEVTSLDPLKVQAEASMGAFSWDEVRPMVL